MTLKGTATIAVKLRNLTTNSLVVSQTKAVTATVERDLLS